MSYLLYFAVGSLVMAIMTVLCWGLGHLARRLAEYLAENFSSDWIPPEFRDMPMFFGFLIFCVAAIATLLGYIIVGHPQ